MLKTTRFTQALMLSTLVSVTALLTGCGSSESNTESTLTSETSTGATTSNSYAVDTSKISSTSITEEACTLTNGDASTCYKITVTGFPSDRTTLGPFCPDNTSVTNNAEVGVWFENGVLYDLTGDFIERLPTFYNDSNWQLHNAASGAVNVTTTEVACRAAAQPQVEAQYQNHCVKCEISYFAEGGSGTGVSTSFTIPKTPVPRATSGAIGTNGVGVAFNGVKIDAAAPTNAILSAYTIAALDDCVGHVNPVAGYHYHGANHGNGTCSGIDAEGDGHGGAFAYALDGYAILAMLDSEGNEETDLDSCRGHSDATRGYHYHTAGPGENAFIGCFSGETVGTTTTTGPGGPGGPPQ